MGMFAAFGAAVLVGVYLVSVGGLWIVAIGAASIASGYAYTGGPWPLGYHGLGDLFVFVFFGLVAVCGTVFVATGQVTAFDVLAAVPVGALATAVLVVNNVRDGETDRVASKRTLVVRFGRRFGVVEYVTLVATAYVGTLAVAALASSAWLLLPLATIPLAGQAVRVVATRHDGPSLNGALAATARLLLVFAALFALGTKLQG